MKEIKRLQEQLRGVTCKIEEWIEAHDSPKRSRHIKRLDKAVFLIKVGSKIMKRANARAQR